MTRYQDSPATSPLGFCSVTWTDDGWLVRVYRHAPQCDSLRPLLVDQVLCLTEDDARELALEKLRRLGGCRS